jgi:hypothetical protein
MDTVLPVVALLASPVAVWAIACLVFRDKVRGPTILAGAFAGHFAAALLCGAVVWLLSRTLAAPGGIQVPRGRRRRRG